MRLDTKQIYVFLGWDPLVLRWRCWLRSKAKQFFMTPSEKVYWWFLIRNRLFQMGQRYRLPHIATWI